MRKVILITGVSSGLGKIVAEYLVSEGHIVWGTSRHKTVIKGVNWISLDVTSEEECHLAVRKILKKENRIDVLINNAGYTISGETVGFKDKDFANIVDTNAIGAFRLIKEAVPVMKRQKFGKIINITSLNGIISLPNFGIYSASKHALHSLGVALHYELEKYGIGVTNLAPGAIDSEGGEALANSYKPAREKFKVLYYLMPMLKRTSVAEKIEFLILQKNSPSEVIMGNDAIILTLLKRFSPSFIWDLLMYFVWRKK